MTAIPYNETVTVLDRSNGTWYTVKYNGYTGYVLGEYIEIETAANASSVMTADIDLPTGGMIDPNPDPDRTIEYGYAESGWKDRLTSYDGDSITYDAIGNPLTYRDGMTLTWEGRQLKTLVKDGTTSTYTYDADGLRIKKTAGSLATVYQYVNGQLLRERRSNGVVLRYMYDALGNLSCIRYTNIDNWTKTFFVRCNSSGDVTQIYDTSGNFVASYTYDAWGNTVAITDANGNAITASTHVAVVNPIRYRGYYWDAETGFYYLQSRYYDPEIKRFISADSDEVLSTSDESLIQNNLYVYCFNNPITYSDSDGNWPEWATKVLVGTAVIAAAAILTVATAGTGTALACFAVGALKGALVGAAVGAATGAATGAVSHRVTTGSWSGAGTAALNGAADGYMTGAISGFITGGATSNACFVAGTEILTEAGKVAIETIRPGDMVVARDPEIDEEGLKEVVRVFEKETQELVHVHVEGEEIVTTAEHPFYVLTRGWVGAGKLRAGDKLLRVNGEEVVVEWIQHELLESPVKVYNFEVADYHTYFVSDVNVLVHNLCEDIAPYKYLRKVNKGTGTEAHHIIEKRFAKPLNLGKTNNMLSVSLTKEKHQFYTNAWRKILEYGKAYDRNAVAQAAAQVYEDDPRLLAAAMRTLFT